MLPKPWSRAVIARSLHAPDNAAGGGVEGHDVALVARGEDAVAVEPEVAVGVDDTLDVVAALGNRDALLPAPDAVFGGHRNEGTIAETGDDGALGGDDRAVGAAQGQRRQCGFIDPAPGTIGGVERDQFAVNGLGDDHVAIGLGRREYFAGNLAPPQLLAGELVEGDDFGVGGADEHEAAAGANAAGDHLVVEAGAPERIAGFEIKAMDAAVFAGGEDPLAVDGRGQFEIGVALAIANVRAPHPAQGRSSIDLAQFVGRVHLLGRRTKSSGSS